MNCLSCGHKNPATVGYCQKCGGRMDLTADEIQAALVEKAKGERQKDTEFWARQSLVFSLILVLITLTLLVLAGGAPEQSYYVPSASNGAGYVEVKYDPNLSLPKLQLPVEPRRKGR